MDGAAKAKGEVDVHILEARVHRCGKPDAFVVVGRLFCSDPWVIVEIAADFHDEVIISTLTDLAMAGRPLASKALRGIDSRYWSFVLTDAIPDRGAN